MNIAVILANGTGSRFGSDKLQHMIKNHSIFQYSILTFENHVDINEIVIVGDKKYKNFKNIPGGKIRFESVKNAIRYCSDTFSNDAKIIFHNAANPFVTEKEITQVLQKIKKNRSVGVGHQLHGTIRKTSANNTSQTINRENLYEMQTPQGAILEDFVQWIDNKNLKEKNITDELALAENYGAQTLIIPASKQNIKITTMNDIANPPINHSIPITGFGIDSHRFEHTKTDKKCMLCGVVLQNTLAFKGNSDADVALHALSNAILSALGKNSFSEIANPLCKKGITDSAIYLKKILKIIQQKNKNIIHLSLTFEGKRPKVEQYFQKFRTNLSKLLHLSEENIGLNATTGENIDGYGKGEGMKVSAVVTLV